MRSKDVFLIIAIGAAVVPACGRTPDPQPTEAESEPLTRTRTSSSAIAPRANGLAKGPDAQFGPVVSQAVAVGESQPLRSLVPGFLLPFAQRRAEHERAPVRPLRPVPRGFVDPVVQRESSANAAPAPTKNFEGQTATDSGCNCIPPDTNGAAGATQYVQMVNSSLAVYAKSDGARISGPVQINSLFSGLPETNECRINNDGDPVVIYDQLARRWLLSQFAAPGDERGYHECIAISKTEDATGEYWLYDFKVGETEGFQDYPHFGLWTDGYYMSSHRFNPEYYYGSSVFAFERDKMLAGQPAQMVTFFLRSVDPGTFGHLPVSLDGYTLPPAGTPAYFVEVEEENDRLLRSRDQMRIWKFSVDWTTPENSTFGINGGANTGYGVEGGQADYEIPVAAFERPACVRDQGNCVPQPGSYTQLDPLGDRLMFRAAYRNFGDHDSLIINHTVVADGTTQQLGPRWYEVRNLTGGGTPTIFQQGTFAPDSGDLLYRWMGSAAMDARGNIAIGYSTSSASQFPSIAYAGRLASDPLGTLAQGETQIWAGGGPENPYLFVGPAVGRWGDYSALTVDPVDDNTFWFTTEYFPDPATDPVGHAGTVWHTRIASFRLPDPVVTGNQPPVATLTAVPTSGVAPLQVNFTVAAIDPNAGDTLTYDLDFGDATPHSAASGAVAHTYSAVGAYTAALTVTDNSGASDTEIVTITVTANTVPVASLTPDSVTKPAGQSVIFTAAGSDADPGDKLTYDLDFGDATAHRASSGAVAHTYATAGSYTATLTVTDSHNGQGTDSSVVTITDQPTDGHSQPATGNRVWFSGSFGGPFLLVLGTLGLVRRARRQ